MTLQRGDLIMTRIPHVGGTRGKKRPAVIIQADSYNGKLKHFIVAESPAISPPPTTWPAF
jgi:mRNA-degrading endonuclease toxin of MazEF toxin-antitoxin module